MIVLRNVKWIYLPGLGQGWKTAVLISAVEFDIIVANVNGLGSVSNFYIGGSTNITDASRAFGFSEYFPNSLGIT